MTHYASQVPASCSYDVLFPLAFCWRIFSNGHFWSALLQVKAVSASSPPAWSKIRAVMEIFSAENQTWYSGLFYSGNKLIKFRYALTDQWQCCTACKMDDIDRLLEAMKIVWFVANTMKEAFQDFQSKPTQAGWRTCTQTFLQEVRSRTSGMFNDYSLKKALDGILISQPRLEKVVSYWPMNCPAYQKQLPLLYPGIQCTQEELYTAACHYHRQIKVVLPKFRLADSLAQLCWLKRKVS